jgi:hypothetical protein
MSETIARQHTYHAEATVLKGHLLLPLAQEIKPQAYAKLPEEGGYLAQKACDYRLESAISFRSAHTQVAGNLDIKPGHGWTTLTTAVVEGLNAFDVVTADKVVGQIAIEHPLAGYVPKVSFLGTHFDNLRIGGHPVKLDCDLDLFGQKPENDAPYTQDPGFIRRVNKQHEQVRAHPSLLEELVQRYTGLPSKIENPEAVECSLVNQAEGSFPGRCFGHVIEVPDFGTIVLGALRLEQSDFQVGTGIPKSTLFRLTMIELKLGCLAAGSVPICQMHVNGRSHP